MFRRLFSRGRTGPAHHDPALRDWRARAGAAAASGTRGEVEALIAAHEAAGWRDGETDLDLERLSARLDLLAFDARLAAGELPVLATQHKAVGTDRCHFMAPAVWCGETDHPGKLFITDVRLRFVGGPGVAIKWSALKQVAVDDRDLLVLPLGDTPPRRFRCNSFGDALVAERLIAHLRR